jgi:hypothetical protein
MAFAHKTVGLKQQNQRIIAQHSQYQQVVQYVKMDNSPDPVPNAK